MPSLPKKPLAERLKSALQSRPNIIAPDQQGKKNPNWKGGLSQFKTADDLVQNYPEIVPEVYRRLLLLIEKDPVANCWNCKQVFKSNGRACITFGRQRHLAYRLMYAITRGALGKQKVLHSCDNPACFNPEHLSLGTSQDNADDMVAKDRQAKGEKNAAAKLTEELVREIRVLHLSGKSIASLARRFEVSWTTVQYVVTGKSWTHVKEGT